MRLDKVKRPGGIFSFDLLLVDEDDNGTWLYGPIGSPWAAPHDAGELPVDVLLLLHPERHWVAWWVDDPADRRLELDICLPPDRTIDGWTYVDLELDPVRHEHGTIEVEDHDEFDVARRNGWMSEADAAIALATATTLEAALRERDEPFGEEGWRRLDAARS